MNGANRTEYTVFRRVELTLEVSAFQESPSANDSFGTTRACSNKGGWFLSL
jgi:hypothetical protein